MKINYLLLKSTILFTILTLVSCKLIDFGPPYVPPQRPEDFYYMYATDTSCNYLLKDSVTINKTNGYAPLQVGNTWIYYYYYGSSNTHDKYPFACTVTVRLENIEGRNYKFKVTGNLPSWDSLYSSFTFSDSLLDTVPPKFLPTFTKDTSSIATQILLDDSSSYFQIEDISASPVCGITQESKFKSKIGLILHNESNRDCSGGASFYYLLLLKYNNQEFNFCEFYHESRTKEAYLKQKSTGLLKQKQ